MTHDDKRNATTTLFAVLGILTGEVSGICTSRHRHEEWIAFLTRIDMVVDLSLGIHIIADNDATHNHSDVKAWLTRRPRFYLHVTPTSSSWFTLVERWFRDLTGKALTRGVFHSVSPLIFAIHACIDAGTKDPKPFVWTTSADDVIEKVTRAHATLPLTKTHEPLHEDPFLPPGASFLPPRASFLPPRTLPFHLGLVPSIWGLFLPHNPAIRLTQPNQGKPVSPVRRHARLAYVTHKPDNDDIS
jgi:hypothetical protein